MASALRSFSRLARSVSTDAHITPPSTAISIIPPPPRSPSQTAHRDAHTSSISDPNLSSSSNISEPLVNSSVDTEISLAPHSHDSSSYSTNGSSSSLSNSAPISLNVPVPPDHPHLNGGLNPQYTKSNAGSPYQSPPFHTHRFFKALEETFPTTTARSLMRATRALLVDRTNRVQREGLTRKDLDNVRPLSIFFFYPISLHICDRC